jgi:hypothetical protein
VVKKKATKAIKPTKIKKASEKKSKKIVKSKIKKNI